MTEISGQFQISGLLGPPYVSSWSTVYYASVTRHNTLYTVLKQRAYFMTVIDGVVCVGRACYEQNRDVSADRSEIVRGYNTVDTAVKDRKIK